MPKGKENNWVQTIPVKGWNTIFGLYGPLESWFDQTWRPGEIELINYAHLGFNFEVRQKICRSRFLLEC